MTTLLLPTWRVKKLALQLSNVPVKWNVAVRKLRFQ